MSTVAAPPRSRWTGGRIAALVLGILVVLGSVGLLVLGGAVLRVEDSRRESGYLTSDEISLSTEGYAVASTDLDLDSVPDTLLGRGRVRVTGNVSGTPVFIGVARTDDADDYLADVQHATLDEIADPATDYTQRRGGAPAVQPADADIWVAQAAGSGTQTIRWPLDEGRWTVVVMNADGAAGVDVDADVGMTAPWLRRIATGLLVAGGVGVLVGAAFILIPLRKVRRSHLIPATRSNR